MVTAARSGDNLAHTIWNIITKHKLTDQPVVVANKQDVSGAPSKDTGSPHAPDREGRPRQAGYTSRPRRQPRLVFFLRAARRVRDKIKMQGFRRFGQVRKQLRPSAANRSRSIGAFNALDFRLLSAAIVGQFVTE